MKNGKQGAFACVDSQKKYLQEGLTKREYFAGLAMQGLLANHEFIKGGSFDFKSRGTEERLSSISTKLADELLKQLDKVEGA